MVVLDIMALIAVGNGVADIRGGFGGVYFTRDGSGLHCSSKPRRVQGRSAHQDRKRKAFSRARAFSKVNRTVSYNIFRAYLDLDMKEPPLDYPAVK